MSEELTDDQCSCGSGTVRFKEELYDPRGTLGECDNESCKKRFFKNRVFLNWKPW